MKINYKEFVNTYSKNYRNSKFYPEFLKLKNKGLDNKKIKDILKPKIGLTVYSWFNGKVPMPFKEFSKIKTEFDNEDLDYLAIIVGHIMGDGGITKQKFLQYSNTEKFLIDEFTYAMKKVFNAKPTTCYKETSGITRLIYPRLYSRILFCLFGEFSFGRDSKNITLQIDKMPLNWKMKLLRAWYNDDGSVPESGHYRCIAFKQKDKTLILWIQKTLEKVGIKSKLYKDGTTWHLRILNYINMVKFKEKVGFSKGYRKQKHLNEIIKKIIVPHQKTKIKILKLLNEAPRTRKELSKILKLKNGTIYGHLHGWKRSKKSKKKSTLGLLDMGLIKIKKNGKKHIYFLNKKNKSIKIVQM